MNFNIITPLYCAKNELKARAAAAMPAGGSGEKD